MSTLEIGEEQTGLAILWTLLLKSQERFKE